MTADMHVHTLASDGLFTPGEVAALAKAAGLSMVVVTDHDTAANSEKVNTFCQNSGLKTVNGIEISAYVGDVKIHTLGYGFDPSNADFAGLLAALREGSFRRTEDIIHKLNGMGFKIAFGDAAAERADDRTPIHAMHIARAAVRKGYSNDPIAFYMENMMYGREGFSNICRPTPEQAIEVINSAGGLAVIAHPGRIDLSSADRYKLISRLVPAGLGGIEAVYSAHTDEQTAYFREIAKEFGLFVTGGSDTHFAGGNRSIGSPVFQPSDGLLQRLKIC